MKSSAFLRQKTCKCYYKFVLPHNKIWSVIDFPDMADGDGRQCMCPSTWTRFCDAHSYLTTKYPDLHVWNDNDLGIELRSLYTTVDKVSHSLMHELSTNKVENVQSLALFLLEHDPQLRIVYDFASLRLDQ